MSPTGSSPTVSSMTSFTEDDQITELEDRVKSLSHNQSFLPLTHDSAESIATPPDSDFDDEQIRALLASPRYLPEREASAERSQVSNSEREGLMSSSSQSLNFIGTGEHVALFSHQSGLNQDAFSEREQPVDVLGSNESMIRFSDPVTCCEISSSRKY